MQQDNITVTEKRTRYHLPQFEAIDIITLLAFVGALALLMTDRPVPEYVIAIIGLGTGAKMFTEGHMNQARNQSDKLSQTNEQPPPLP